MDNDRRSGTVIFAAEVEQREDNSVRLTVNREDGARKVWDFPANKLKIYRSLPGEISHAIAFLLGESP